MLEFGQRIDDEMQECQASSVDGAVAMTKRRFATYLVHTDGVWPKMQYESAKPDVANRWLFIPADACQVRLVHL